MKVAQQRVTSHGSHGILHSTSPGLDGMFEGTTLKSDDPRIQRALQFIEDHLDRPIRLAAIAGVAAVERKHFSVLFRRATGWKCFDYVRHRRLAHALALLLHGASVREAASASGCHVRTLERLFEQALGTTPAAYRDRMGWPYRNLHLIWFDEPAVANDQSQKTPQASHLRSPLRRKA